MINKILTYCLALLSIFSLSWNLVTHPIEHVDAIELNHFHDSYGQLVFQQVIFWERVPETGRFHVRAWCLVEDRESLNRRPVKNEQTGLYQVDWFDTDQRLRRRITSRMYRESWTTFDPERDDKKRCKESDRISLSKRIVIEPNPAQSKAD